MNHPKEIQPLTLHNIRFWQLILHWSRVFGVFSSRFADTIRVGNAILTGKNTGGQFSMVQFDLGRENSRRHSFSTGINNRSDLSLVNELESEKAACGTLTPVAKEYPWGIISGVSSSGPDNAARINEIDYNGTANCSCGSSLTGSLRVGEQAKTGTSRNRSGASCYGIMDLGGNLLERTVTIGNAEGQAFTGIPGDGHMSLNENANVTACSGLINGEVIAEDGSGRRGGRCKIPNYKIEISQRGCAADTDNLKFDSGGSRVVRSPL